MKFSAKQFKDWHRCKDEHSEDDRARFRERNHQLALATARGQKHFSD